VTDFAIHTFFLSLNQPLFFPIDTSVLLRQSYGNSQVCNSRVHQQNAKRMLWTCSTSIADWAVTAMEEWLVGCFIPCNAGIFIHMGVFCWVGWFCFCLKW